ncbi:hypothetical protein GCG54_00012741 [Colletotrichum gloeosporioides]|uniref:Fibronectin type-III domain-containing protein n=1 Tax=Colletotrichum gloeosporioides TaxID=474922 RepID=A0A8H4CSX5_COLGL|nr:uncharacterized protein GCG54_00012741 [Colletotrichum gloeosporioides]KAF3809460.1 hypothetical protein GCG54_00012741 [Colletotrichum gloeosporioides]
MGFSYDSSLSQPALGRNIKLGMLYDVRTSQFFSGVSLWDNSVVNAKPELSEEQVQNADFVLSHSLEEARNNISLDTEGSLNLDLKLCSAVGSAKFLNDRKSTAHEARLDASCTVMRHTRRIPQEVLASMKYSQYLDDGRYTHFVAEVVEGGSATLSFVKACSSADEARRIAGELKVSVVNVPVSGGDKVEFSSKNEALFDDVKISYSGAIAENVSSLEDARRVAGEMPRTLAKQTNALSCTLLPLSILDRKAGRIIRSLDSSLVTKTAAALKDGNMAGLMLRDLISKDLFQSEFPAIGRQISNFRDAFADAQNEFEQEARRLLPELRDGTKDENTNATALRAAVKLFRQHTWTTKRFIDKKSNEANVLETTLASLSAEKFENHLGALKVQSLTGGAAPRLFLSLGGLSIGMEKHPLQDLIESGTEYSNTEKAKDDMDEEWFENDDTKVFVEESFSALCELRKRSPATPPVTFGVASIDTAFCPGNLKKVSTKVGDIILDNRGRFSIVNGMLPKAPSTPCLSVDGKTITVTLAQGREDSESEIIPTTGFLVKYRRLNSSLRDSALPKGIEDDANKEIFCTISESQAVLSSLLENCDYEVKVSFQTIVGASVWSPVVVERTPKPKPFSIARQVVEFIEKSKRLQLRV